MTHAPSHRREPASWTAANLVVTLSPATSAAAHVEAGGLLPGLPGLALLLPATALLWLAATRSTRSLPGLLANFSADQLLCHLGYMVGTMTAPTLLVDADGTSHWGDPLAGRSMAMGMTGHPASAMPGMDHGSHGAVGMLLAHAAAVLVCTALVLALRHLPGSVRRWARGLVVVAPSHAVPTPAFTATGFRRAAVARWSEAPPPPRRGPPACWA